MLYRCYIILFSYIHLPLYYIYRHNNKKVAFLISIMYMRVHVPYTHKASESDVRHTIMQYNVIERVSNCY